MLAVSITTHRAEHIAPYADRLLPSATGTALRIFTAPTISLCPTDSSDRTEEWQPHPWMCVYLSYP